MKLRTLVVIIKNQVIGLLPAATDWRKKIIYILPNVGSYRDADLDSIDAIA